MIKNFTPRIMQKVSDLFKQIEEATEVTDKNKWIRAKANLWIIIDDLCERFEKIYEEFTEIKTSVENMTEIKDEAVRRIYREWFPKILEYIEENHHKEPLTPSRIAEYFNWDIVMVRKVINQMLEDDLLQICKEWL